MSNNSSIIKNDLTEIFINCCLGNFKSVIILIKKKSLCIVLCDNGYTEDYKKNIHIKGLDKLILKDGEYIFHAGTNLKNKKILVSGGRVLNFVSVSNNLKISRNNLIKLINNLGWDNGFFRKDIGYKVID